MAAFIGVLLIIAGVLLGSYVGLYLCFYGGILQIVNSLQADPISGSEIAMGVVKIMCFALTGAIAAFVLLSPGLAIIKSVARRKGWRWAFNDLKYKLGGKCYGKIIDKSWEKSIIW